MACEPAASVDAFMQAHASLCTRLGTQFVTVPNGMRVKLWDSVADLIGIAVEGLHPNPDCVGFTAHVVASASREIKHVCMFSRQNNGYCPDILYLGPLARFNTGRQVLSVLVRATCAFVDSGYTMRPMSPDRLLDPHRDVPVNIYTYDGTCVTRAQYTVPSGNVYIVRKAAYEALHADRNLDGFQDGL